MNDVDDSKSFFSFEWNLTAAIHKKSRGGL